MKLGVWLALFSASTVWAVPQTLKVGQPFNDGSVTHRLKQVPTPETIIKLIETGNLNDLGLGLDLPISGGEGGDITVIVDQIINLGERIWKIIEDRKPVLNVKRAYANALPKGVRSSEDLDDWSPIQHQSYNVSGKNLFGIKVYDLTYTLIHRFGGTYRGEGQYIENATVLPHDVSALWGYTVDLGVDNVGAVNVGSKDRPVGGLSMELAFRVSTAVKVEELRSIYDFRGDSNRVITQ